MSKLQDIGSGTGTCDISEQFAKGLDGLYGHSKGYIVILFQTSF